MKPLLALLLSLSAGMAAPPALANPAGPTAAQAAQDLPSVAAIDVARYMGTWY